jgi:hypothetical protein
MGDIISLRASDGHRFDAYGADPAAQPKGTAIAPLRWRSTTALKRTLALFEPGVAP